METNRLNNFKNHLEQYNEKFTILNEDNLITATSVKFTEPTIEEKELDLIKFHQKMLKNNNIQLMNKFKETKRNEIKKYKESHRKKEANKPITPYRQEIINTLNNLPLFLEMGAASKTTLNLLSLGLSRLSASIIREKIPSSNMSEQEIKSWLVRFPPESIGLPEHVIKEIKTLKIA